MEKVVKFKSNDGSVFDTEEECLAYEARFDSCQYIHAVNTDLNIEKLINSYCDNFHTNLALQDVIDFEHLMNVCETNEIILIDNGRGLKLFKDACNELGLTYCDASVGFNYWDGQKWVNLTDLLTETSNRLIRQQAIIDYFFDALEGLTF